VRGPGHILLYIPHPPDPGIHLEIDLNAKKILALEVDCLLKGGAALDLNLCPPKPAKVSAVIRQMINEEGLGFRQYTCCRPCRHCPLGSYPQHVYGF
jgi:hypothetical protein